LTTGDLRKFRDAVPFQSFLIYLSDGIPVIVRHPENLALTEDAKTAFVYESPVDFRFIALDQVVEITPLRRERRHD
jgi:hypothetical protein